MGRNTNTTIWKFPLNNHAGIHTVSLPLNAKVLSIQFQRRLPTLWALVDPNIKEVERRTFYISMTGETINHEGELEHLNTILVFDDFCCSCV